MSVTKNYKEMMKAVNVDKLIAHFRQVYINKYYDLYCSLIDIPELSLGYNKTFRSLLWSKGSCWIRKDSLTGEPIVCDYAGATYDWNMEPVTCQLITRNNAPETVIPTSLQVNGRDGVVCYIRPNQKGFEYDVLYYIGKLAEAETVITVNLAVQRTPWILASDEENYNKLKLILNQIFSNHPALITDIDRSELEVINLDAPWITDKVMEYECEIEGKLKTLLGLDNQGGYINRQQQNLDTTNSNNQEINKSQDVWYRTIRKSLDEANKVLGINLTIEMPERVEQMSESHSEGPHASEGEEEDDNR